MATNNMYDLIIVDDDQDTLDYLKHMLGRARDWSVQYLTSCEEAYDLLQDHKTRVLLTDIEFPGMSGVDLITKLRSGDNGGFVAFAMTGGRVQGLSEAGVQHVFTKPFCPKDMLGQLTKALNESRVIG